MSLSRRAVLRQLIGSFALGSTSTLSSVAGEADTSNHPREQSAEQFFEIHVTDDRTGRGVPLVELQTSGGQRYVTDSVGRVAITDPGLMGQQVFFHVKSHGYRHATDPFGYEGQQVPVRPGERTTISIERENIAERLYRVTGRGIYRHSVKLGYDVPLRRPVLNQQVTGQDSIQAIVYDDRIHWFWGDTSRLGHPLGNFRTTGAISRLPDAGGLPPGEGINLDYFGNGDGFVRPMAPAPSDEGNIMWIDRVITVPDGQGRSRLVARYSHRASLEKELGEGLLVFNDEQQLFELLETNLTLGPSWPGARGHATATPYEDGGDSYWLFARPWPVMRVRSELAAVRDPETYEAFTCLEAGSSFEGKETSLDRDASGNIVWAWKRDTHPISQQQERELIDAGLLTEQEARFQLRDVESGGEVVVHGASVRWNAHRQRWIMIGNQIGGSSSFLGDVWYAEADHPTGPWRWARRIVTHDQYSFYNPSHHTFFDRANGRYIHFEGTYTAQFSETSAPTPLYDYNQIMYRLDLESERLDLPLVP